MPEVTIGSNDPVEPASAGTLLPAGSQSCPFATADAAKGHLLVLRSMIRTLEVVTPKDGGVRVLGAVETAGLLHTPISETRAG